MSEFLFMGVLEDPELNVWLGRGIKVYDAISTGPERVGCPILGCQDEEAEGTLCDVHLTVWEASPERASFVRGMSTWEAATNAFGRRLGVKERLR